MYTKKVLKHFKNPKNLGEIKNPDGVGMVGNIICGDVMHLYIKVGKNSRGEGILEDIKFETLGCVAAIATSSIITEIAKGKTIEYAMDLGKKEITEKLGGLPPVKLHCSVLAIDALNEAIYNYFLKNKKEIPEKLKKRHKRIERERAIIEEKFGEWGVTNN